MAIGRGSLENLVIMKRSQAIGPKTARCFGALLVRFLPNRLHRIVRFAMAGVVTTLLYFVLTNILILSATVTPAVASVTGYLISLAVSYALQSQYAFRAERHSPRQVGRYVVTGVAGLVVSWVVMAMFSVLDFPPQAGTVFVCGLIPIANYWSYKTWVFVSHNDGEVLR